jgi:hypothetical protein
MGHDPPDRRPTQDSMSGEPEPVIVLVEWFFDHYEDPVENAPYDSAEGGFQFLWGGPYSAAEELGHQFPSVSDVHVLRAVAIIEKYGTAWTKPPTPAESPRRTDAQRAGDSRLMKVLVRLPSGDFEGHRAYPVAIHEASSAAIVVAATESGDSGLGGLTWGHLYLVQQRDPTQHPWVMEEVASVPHEDGWELVEAVMDERAGHVDPF